MQQEKKKYFGMQDDKGGLPYLPCRTGRADDQTVRQICLYMTQTSVAND